MLIGTTVRNLLTDTQAAFVNLGWLRLYDVSNVVLCSLRLKALAYHPSIEGVATLNVLGGLSGSPVANGTAHHYEVLSSDEEFGWSGVCGLTDSGKAMELVSMEIFIGIPIAVSSGSLTTPAGTIDPTL